MINEVRELRFKTTMVSLLTAALLCLCLALTPTVIAETASTAGVAPELLTKLASVQVPFVPNQGQVTDARVKFYAQTFAGTIFVTDEGIVYNLHGGEKGGCVLKEEFAGGKSQMPIAASTLASSVNYYIGSDTEQWQQNLPSYYEVNLGEIYDKINVSLQAGGNNVEKIFTVAPGGDPAAISLRVTGTDGLSINAQGELELITGLGKVTMTRPVAYQFIDGQQVDVSVAYIINDDSYGFRVGEYDHSYPLVIDPLLASTFLGGSNAEGGRCIVLDKYGYVYVAGQTKSNDFPGSANGAYSSYNDSTNYDLFVAKLSPDLTQLLAATYLGGSYADSIAQGNCLAVAPSGEIYLTGYTKSSNFPMRNGYDSTFNDQNNANDVFIARLSGDLSKLESATFLGGGADERPYSLAIDGNGNVFVAGFTYPSDEGNLPVTQGAKQIVHYGSAVDGFISKLNPDLSMLMASTYLGGEQDDYINCIALDANGNVYVGGYTMWDGDSSSVRYPVTAGSYDTVNGGNMIREAFVSKLDSDLAVLQASTYLGTDASSEVVSGIALGSEAGNVVVFVAGHYADAYIGTDFPTTDGVYQKVSKGGDNEMFIAKLNGSLSSPLNAATYLGSSGVETFKDIALDSSGNVYIAATSDSDDGYPHTEGVYSSSRKDSSGHDMVITAMNGNLTGPLISSTYFGGNGNDNLYDMALDAYGNVYLIGNPNSMGYETFPLIPGSYQTTKNGASDAFISRLTGELSGGVVIDNTAPTWIDGSSLNVSDVTTSSLKLTWTPAIDNVGVKDYKIFKNNVETATVSSADGTAASGLVSLNITGLNEGATYSFRVEAIDAASNSSSGGPTASGTTLAAADLTPPHWTDGKLEYSNLSDIGVILTWSGAEDNKGVSGYQLTGNGSVAATVYDATTYSLSNLTPGTAYSFQVQAFDAAGNMSSDGPVVNITTSATTDTVAPYWTIASSAEYTYIAISPTQTYFKWPAALDNVGVTGYQLCIKNPPNAADYSVLSTVYGRTDYTITLPDTPGISYPFSIRAFDAVGNLSPYSVPAQLCSGETIGVYLKGAYLTAITGNPLASSFGASIEDSTSVPLKAMFNMNFSNNVVNNEGDAPIWPGNQQCFTLQTVGGSVYEPIKVMMIPDTIGFIERNYIFVAPVNKLTPNTQYKLTISPDLMPKNKKRTMSFERVVYFTTEASASGVDAWTPEATLTASNPTASGVTLTWTPADAGAGVSSYAIIKDNSEIIAAVDGATTSSIVTGLAPGTNYDFKVLAFNSTTNWCSSGPSTTAVTGSDTATPTWPNAILSESNVAGHSLTLTWSAASDDGTVTGYRIYRDGTQVGEVSGTTLSYNVSGLAAETSYTFKVEAGDAAGHWSSDGPSRTVKTTVSTGEELITGSYTVTPADDAAYTIGATSDGIDTMTVNAGQTGSRSFIVNVSPVTAHAGNEKAVFVQFRNGQQVDLNVSVADFDAVNSASASFAVQPGDVIKVFIVDDLYTISDRISTVLEQ